jgi:Na+/pantothenate symporter
MCFIIHYILAKPPIKMEPVVFLNPENHLIESLLIVAATSLSMYTIEKSVRNSSSILLRSLVLTIFMAENDRSVVAVETGRVSTSTITRKAS